MGEFKGTKTNWVIDNYNGKGCVIDIISDVSDDEVKQIAQVYSLGITNFNDYQDEELTANAQLISCAPEMLEMLIKLSYDFEDEELEQLIKKATCTD